MPDRSHKQSRLSYQIDAGLYGNHLSLDGRYIDIDDLPSCVMNGMLLSQDCDGCTHFIPSACPFMRDPVLFADLQTFSDIREEKARREKKMHRALGRAIHAELEKHGRPLHLDVITRIVMQRYAELKPTPYLISHIIYTQTRMFEKVEPAVFRAKKPSGRR